MAEMPTRKLMAAATKNVPWMPRVGIRYNPAANVPTIDPAVLEADNPPRRSPIDLERAVADLTTSGSVAPINTAGTMSTANDITNRTSVSTDQESARRGYRRT